MATIDKWNVYPAYKWRYDDDWNKEFELPDGSKYTVLRSTLSDLEWINHRSNDEVKAYISFIVSMRHNPD